MSRIDVDAVNCKVAEMDKALDAAGVPVRAEKAKPAQRAPFDTSWIVMPEELNPCPVCGENRGYRPIFSTQTIEPVEYCASCAKNEKGREEAERAARYEKERQQKLNEARLNIPALLCEIGVPERYSTATLQTFDFMRLPNIVEQCVTWAIDGKSIFFYGMPGTGKTHLAAAVCHKLFYNGAVDVNRIRFVTVPDLLAWVREGISLETHEPRIQLYCTIKTLVLDDLGAERPTEYAKETLYRIVNERYNKRLHTIITSNYAPDKEALAKHLGSRLTSRLSSMQSVYTGKTDCRTGGSW